MGKGAASKKTAKERVHAAVMGSTLSQRLGRLLALSLLGGVVVLIGLFLLIGSGVLLIKTYSDSRYDATARDLQQYVTQQSIESNETKKLLKWARKRDGLGLGLIYPDGAPGAADSQGDSTDVVDVTADYQDSDDYYSSYDDHYYRIKFADQYAVVNLYGTYGEDLVQRLDVVAGLISIVMVFVFFLMGVRKRIRYIGELEDDIVAIGGGDLQTPVRVEGNDELGSLATQLEDLRVTLGAQIEAEESAQQANRDLVTAMSHDLRTPLTSLLLYTEILRDGKYRDEGELHAYLDRIYTGATHIKGLSDELLHHFLVAEDPAPEEAAPEEVPLGLILGDVVAGFASALEAADFTFEVEGDLSDEETPVEASKVERVFNNLLSNVLKYGDKDEPVVMACASGEASCTVGVRNAVRPGVVPSEEAGIGLRSVRSLMGELGGTAQVTKTEGTFAVELEFVRKGQRQS